MELSTAKFGFDTKSLAITASMLGAQAIMGHRTPGIITSPTPEKFGILTVVMAGPLGFTATHVANKLIGKKTNVIQGELGVLAEDGRGMCSYLPWVGDSGCRGCYYFAGMNPADITLSSTYVFSQPKSPVRYHELTSS